MRRVDDLLAELGRVLSVLDYARANPEKSDTVKAEHAVETAMRIYALAWEDAAEEGVSWPVPYDMIMCAGNRYWPSQSTYTYHLRPIDSKQRHEALDSQLQPELKTGEQITTTAGSRIPTIYAEGL